MSKSLGKRKCAFPNCKSRAGEGISFFSFPVDPNRSKIWAKACNRDDLLRKTVEKLHKYKLCELHFEERYKSKGGIKKSLFNVAVPTIFPSITVSFITTNVSERQDPSERIPNKVLEIVDFACPPSSASTSSTHLSEEQDSFEKISTPSKVLYVGNMDMDVDADDSMDIDEPLPVTPIIERKSDDFHNTSENANLDASNYVEVQNTAETSAETKEPVISDICENPKSNQDTTLTDGINISNSNQLSDTQSILILDDDEGPVSPPPTPTSAEKVTASAEVSSGTSVKEVIDLVEKPMSNRCINTNCKGRCLKFIFAPDFCLSYFRVKKSTNNQEEICMNCYDQAIEDNDKLATSLKEGKLLFNVDFPIINETLQIDDSDEEDGGEEEMEYISDENFKYISENIEDILMETIDKLDVKKHIEKERNYLKDEAQKIEKDCEELANMVQDIRTVLDKVQIDLYNQFRPELRHLKGIMILDDFSLSPILQIRPENNPPQETYPRKSNRIGQRTVTYGDEFGGNSAPPKNPTPPSQAEIERPKDLPVSLLLDKPVPQIDGIYYIAKENNPEGSWIKARLQQVILPDTSYKGQTYTTTHYKLIELKQQKERIVSGKSIAYSNSCKSRLTVGSRVVSVFKETNQSQSLDVRRARMDPYYAGVVGEHPVDSNKYRYLIFFDIGYAQYVPHSGINLVFEANKDVSEDVSKNIKDFIKKYLESRDRPMVKLTPNQTIRVEYNGKWWLCTIKDVDCSLVQIYFDQLNRWEWIYRGSTRLSPMYREEMAASSRQIGARPPRKSAESGGTVVQYTRNDAFVPPPATPKEDSSSAVTRAVARKSTTRPNAVNQPPPQFVRFLPPVNNSTPNVTGPTSKIMYFTPRDQQVTKREYNIHECGPECKLSITHNFTKLRGHNPLSKPLLCGWARMTLKDRGRKEIIYKAPCGRMIRNISEIHYYLSVTESEMTVDLFDFNHMVRCLAEFSVECAPDPKDLADGREQVPIPVINGFNNDMLDFCNYSTKRVPMGSVHMNLNEEFLCGCDCDDDCVDKLKCSCWKLTLEGLKYLGKDVDPISVGYIYRRLQEQVITGIYECNSRCKCGPTCLNRVAQNPMSLKLQVFKTHNRGWGIRCLNDIPQGTFICIYAGTIHTEQMANEDGMQYGDEYFAELDYIETVEKFKEDYEEDVMEDQDFEKEKTPPLADETKSQKHFGYKKRNAYMDDNDFTPSVQTVARINNSKADVGIRSRLRKRKDDDEKKEKEEKKDKDEKKVKEADAIVKLELPERDVKTLLEGITDSIDTVTISDDEDDGREVLSFNPKAKDVDERSSKYISVRELFGPDEKDNIYIMDAKNAGNIGRFLNHSCSPNVFVQNVFVDTHDLRFPWVAFFSSQFIRAGTELTWNYNYDIGSVPGRVLYCHCASLECKGRLL